MTSDLIIDKNKVRMYTNKVIVQRQTYGTYTTVNRDEKWLHSLYSDVDKLSKPYDPSQRKFFSKKDQQIQKKSLINKNRHSLTRAPIYNPKDKISNWVHKRAKI